MIDTFFWFQSLQKILITVLCSAAFTVFSKSYNFTKLQRRIQQSDAWHVFRFQHFEDCLCNSQFFSQFFLLKLLPVQDYIESADHLFWLSVPNLFWKNIFYLQSSFLFLFFTSSVWSPKLNKGLSRVVLNDLLWSKAPSVDGKLVSSFLFLVFSRSACLVVELNRKIQ